MSIGGVLILAVVFLFVGLFGTVAIQLLTGKINTSGLFYGVRRDRSRYFSPERVQLLIFTLAAALQYLSGVFQHHNSGTLPPVSQTWLALLTGSHTVYLTRKAYVNFRNRTKRSL